MSAANLRVVEGNTSVDKSKALDAALSQIERAFGKGSIMRLGKNQQAVEIETVPTGSLGLDIALGVGGLPRGRVVEIYGPESSGKTTLTLHVIAEAQKKGGICAFIDAEHALDPSWAKRIGVNLDEMLVSQPDTGEQALEIADMLIRSGAVSLIVIDSVAALVPRAEIEGEMGDSHVGLQARLMSQALRKITGALSTSGTTAIFTDYLAKTSTLFKDAVGSGASVKWPAASTVGGKGNEGVAANVNRVKGSLGYVEYAYAKKNKLTFISLKNKDGQFVAPDDLTFAAAAAGTDWSKVPGMGTFITNASGAKSWPITGASFILIYKNPENKANVAEVIKFFDFAFKDGKKMAEDLDYVPMPDKTTEYIRKNVFTKIATK